MPNPERDFSDLPRWQQVGLGAVLVVGVAFMAEIEGNIPAVTLPLEAARFVIETVV